MIIIFSRSVRRSVRGSANPAGISFSVFCPRYPNANYADRKKNNKIIKLMQDIERKKEKTVYYHSIQINAELLSLLAAWRSPFA